ncbi:hypothetical protein [Sinorhizobium meliloti]|uniref:hypothetical protein n=1 Tax=Rhizobium meliloti TaxID=382 RepID=UPI0030B6A90E
MDEIAQDADAGAKVDDAPAAAIEGKIGGEIPRREECTGSTVDVVCALMPVLKDEILFLLCQPILGQDGFGFGVCLALRFREFRHWSRSPFSREAVFCPEGAGARLLLPPRRKSDRRERGAW